MSTARWGKKWADVDEDDDEDEPEQNAAGGVSRFETKADKDGIKTVIEYVERDGATYRVTRRVKQITTKKWSNVAMRERLSMNKFGKVLTNSEADERTACVKSVEAVNIEVAKKVAVDLSQKDDAEEKFFEESLSITESLMKEKKAWTDRNKELTEDIGVGEEKKEEEKKPDTDANAAGKYVPPSLRNAGADGKGGGKGGKGGKGGDGQVEASLRVFNLSDDVKEGDLQDLFGQCGRLQRVFLAKDMTTFQSKGFAFITFYNREDAQRAIDRLNGHGYDNLIMKVEWAKPRA